MKKDVNKLYRLVEDFFGYKCQMLGYYSEKLEVTCILYESFLMKCGFDSHHGEFGASIVLAKGFSNCTFLLERISLNSDEESIKESLRKIDEHCRLRLPDKFLDAFEAAHQEYQDSLYEDIL